MYRLLRILSVLIASTIAIIAVSYDFKAGGVLSSWGKLAIGLAATSGVTTIIIEVLDHVRDKRDAEDRRKEFEVLRFQSPDRIQGDFDLEFRGVDLALFRNGSISADDQIMPGKIDLFTGPIFWIHFSFPGPKTRWIGLQRAADFALALEAQHSIGES